MEHQLFRSDHHGFTLTEILVIVALLGAFLIGLLATVDPFEQLKKGTDATRADITHNLYNAIVRAYSSRGVFPVSSDITGVLLNSPEGMTLVGNLTGQGELKKNFLPLTGSNASHIYLTITTDGKTLSVCFDPKSKSYKSMPQSAFTATGTVSDDCHNTACYYCIGENAGNGPATPTNQPIGPSSTPTAQPTISPTRTPTATQSPTPFVTGFTSLSSSLIPGRATFSFTYSGLPAQYTIDMSIDPLMSGGTYLTFAQGPTNTLTESNPEKWDQYTCLKNFYWRVKTPAGTRSAIQHAMVTCGPTPTATPFVPSPTPGDPPVTRNVMVIDFNPILENEGGRRLREYKGWTDPLELESLFISDIQTASNGYFQYHIVTRMADIDAYPQKSTGYVFTDASYISALSSQDANARAIINYNKVLTDYDVCGRVNRGEIDELWLWGGPWFGYWEAVMAGPGAYVTNASPILGTTCNRKLHILGFSYERGIAEMLEDFGHRTEGTMRTVYGGWFAGSNTDWDKYTKSKAFHAADGTFGYGCGTVHEPFNAAGAYDWSNASSVQNTCVGWSQYPPASTAVTVNSCSLWGCTGYGYLKLWLSNLPKASGQTNGKWNNWWKYLGDIQ